SRSAKTGFFYAQGRFPVHGYCPLDLFKDRIAPGIQRQALGRIEDPLGTREYIAEPSAEDGPPSGEMNCSCQEVQEDTDWAGRGETTERQNRSLIRGGKKFYSSAR